MTTITTDTPAAHLVPRPLSDDYDRNWFNLPEADRPTDTYQVWGHCAEFCVSSDSPQTDGLAVEGHGVWCRSRTLVYLDGRDMTAERATLGVEVVMPYTHGTYKQGDLQTLSPSRETEVQVTVYAGGVPTDADEHDGKRINLSAGDARRMAAGLVRAADVADHLDRNFCGEKEARRSGR